MSNKIKYKSGIVSFFDILGFRKIVKSKSAEEIYEILETFNRHSKPDEELASLFEMEFTFFSDSIVRSISFFNEQEYPIDIFFNELIDLLHIQSSLIHKEILIRGAVSIEDIFHNDQVIFGPGLVKAYDLENKYAKYPRIVLNKSLTDSLFSLFKKNAPKVNIQDDVNYILNLLRIGEDDIYFIDYLRIIVNEIDHPSDYVNFLNHHRDLIIDNYSPENEASIIEKHSWLAEYHNDVVDFMSEGLRDLGCELDQLMISESIIPSKGLLYEGNDIWRQDA